MNTGDIKQLENFYSIFLEIENSVSQISYKYISVDEFKKLTPIEWHYKYWYENIQKFHICGLTSILRLKKWYEAVESAYKSQNYYGFCAALRGGIEACADSFYSLNGCVVTIAENFSLIKLALEKVPLDIDKFSISQELEDSLIHYSYARKLTNSEKVKCDNSHNAEQVRTYLNSLKNEKIIELYAELCQVTHPSAYSLTPFFINISENEQCYHSLDIDKKLMDKILLNYVNPIINTIEVTLGPALCSLKIVNLLFDSIDNHLRTDENLLIILSEYKFWQILEEKINKI
ncbi:hypothetical protein [Acinetobacter celticus]|uniref:Uncharacterized protein n=1 Tax=Acinetobacter celticus TaxID=1891224 RepID=A0A1C3CVH3_9GAMM|nr:hypothetical protein [Acinetobacter celticus]ODA12727.1 hypothetical protein BBP83_09210 [Acinetobacter celticus]